MSEERAPYKSRPTGSARRPTDREIITRGGELLKAGILPSAIPGRLMDEFSLTPEKARGLGGKAIDRHKQSH